jgi:hypothetical protein
MAKVADVKLKWMKSVSSGITKVAITVINDGTTTSAELGAEVESFMIEVKANGVVSFFVDTFDDEGNKTTSATYSFSVGDLEAPLPATDLGHEIVGVRDVPDA